VGAVVEGSLPDVEPARSDGATGGTPDAGQPAGRRGIGRRSPRQPSSPVKRRRRKFGILSGLKRLWIPLVILAVIGAGGFAVSKLRSVFGTEEHLSYSDTQPEDTKPIDPKHMRYEIFGPPGTVAMISYFGANGDPEKLKAVSLPWSVEFPITTAASVGSVAAQGNSGSLSCRISVDGEIKTEKTAHHEISTFVSCILKAA
jgi:hypothetical protein